MPDSTWRWPEKAMHLARHSDLSTRFSKLFNTNIQPLSFSFVQKAQQELSDVPPPVMDVQYRVKRTPFSWSSGRSDTP